MIRQPFYGMGLFLLMVAASVLPQSAQADVLYTFSGSVGGVNNTFSFTAPSVFTNNQTSLPSFSISNVSFTSGIFDASSGCFTFSTSSASNCSAFGTTAFYAAFSSPTQVGTFTALGGGCSAAPGQPCESVSRLVISQMAATTPEPSSLVLLASGALGVGGVLRRRWMS